MYSSDKSGSLGRKKKTKKERTEVDDDVRN